MIWNRTVRVIIFAAYLLICLTVTAFAETFDADFVPAGYLSKYEGSLPYAAYDYAANPGRSSVDQNVMVDPEYSFRIVLDYDGNGINDLASRTTYPAGKRETIIWKGNKETVFVLGKNISPKPKVRYSKLILYKKQWIDVETSVLAWGARDNSTAYFSGGFLETYIYNVDWIKLEHRFYLAGTNTTAVINGFLTYNDIDLRQGISLMQSQVDKIWCNRAKALGGQGTRLQYLETDGVLKIKDTSGYDAPLNPVNEEEIISASRAVFSYMFSGDSHIQYYTDGRNSTAKKAFFGFSAAKVIPSDLPGSGMTTKTVSDGNEEEGASNTISEDSESWTYHVNAPVPLETEAVNYIDGLIISDDIDSCLEVKNVSVYRGEKEDVSDWFQITVTEDQKTGASGKGEEETSGVNTPSSIVAEAKDTYSKDFYGYTYSLVVEVGLQADQTALCDHGHINEADDHYQIHNQAKVTYRIDSQDYQRQTNDAVTILQLPQPGGETSGEDTTSTLHITKRLFVDDLHKEHGKPVFIFRLSGVTDGGEAKEYYQLVDFPSSADDPEETGRQGLTVHQDGVWSKTIDFQNLAPGAYICEEVDIDRFRLSRITDVSSNGAVQEGSVSFLLGNGDEGHATFSNAKTDWGSYSDSVCLVNRLGAGIPADGSTR